jgi:hypothetical protein
MQPATKVIHPLLTNFVSSQESNYIRGGGCNNANQNLRVRCEVQRAVRQRGFPGCCLVVKSAVASSPRVPPFGSRDSCGIHLSFTWTEEPAVAASLEEMTRAILRKSFNVR